MIDWNWPIEFLDGTPAWWEQDSIGSRFVIAAEQPFGVAMARKRNGLYQLLAEESDPRIRNVELPAMLFEDGTAPTGASFNYGGRSMRVDQGETFHICSWPRLIPSDSKVKLIVMNKAALEKEELDKEEREELEANDLYGMF